MADENLTPGTPGAWTPPPPPPPVAPPPIITPLPPNRPKGNTVWKALAVIFIALFVISMLGNFFLSISRTVFAPMGRSSTRNDHNLEEVVIEKTNLDAKIAVITVDGIITGGEQDHTGLTLQEYVNEQLKAAQDDSDVKAVILKVDSPGARRCGGFRRRRTSR